MLPYPFCVDSRLRPRTGSTVRRSSARSGRNTCTRSRWLVEAKVAFNWETLGRPGTTKKKGRIDVKISFKYICANITFSCDRSDAFSRWPSNEGAFRGVLQLRGHLS